MPIRSRCTRISHSHGCSTGIMVIHGRMDCMRVQMAKTKKAARRTLSPAMLSRCGDEQPAIVVWRHEAISCLPFKLGLSKTTSSCSMTMRISRRDSLTIWLQAFCLKIRWIIRPSKPFHLKESRNPCHQASLLTQSQLRHQPRIHPRHPHSSPQPVLNTHPHPQVRLARMEKEL